MVTAGQIKNLIKAGENKKLKAEQGCSCSNRKTGITCGQRNIDAATAYAEILNGTASLEIEEVFFEGEVLKILYKQGVARVDLTAWPDYPKQLMLDICKPFESLL